MFTHYKLVLHGQESLCAMLLCTMQTRRSDFLSGGGGLTKGLISGGGREGVVYLEKRVGALSSLGPIANQRFTGCSNL